MFYIDSANVKDIKTIIEHYTIKGVTTNPTLMSKENRTDYLHHLKEIGDLIQPNRLFIQVNAEDYEAMLQEVKLINKHMHTPFSIKVPATKEGFKLMRAISPYNHVTATAVVGFQQALQAINSGAKRLAVYVNRMIASGLAPFDMIHDLRSFIELNQYDVEIIAASFKTGDEARVSLINGAHAVTLNPALFESVFLKPLTEKSVKQFSKDFYMRYKKRGIHE